MTTDHKISDQIREHFPLANLLNADEAALAVIAGVPQGDVERLGNDPEFLQTLSAEVRKAELDGRLLKPLANIIMTKGLNRIRELIDSVDPVEAAEFMKPAQRVLDAADKRDALSKDKYDGLKMINIIIGSNMSMAVTPVSVDAPPAKSMPTHVIQDIDTKPQAAVPCSDGDAESVIDPLTLLWSAKPLDEAQGGE